ncbi:MAG TPA: TIM44-like domain-containing protein [Aromatoleum sp.]|uniref:Tim44 domain-containing protein n=1 Tax=Aromatoleum sp. TaxID=2307007 RepID=UPI002B482607|nr:TIM44-like domain-containing protein [Aromatoleum sp.]HJV25574.1 TIM44-like domain-containing protein [Aromatoleum sp.]
MKRILLALFALVLSVGAAAPDAEAKRLGSSQSFGMQRSTPSTAPTAPPARTATTPTQSPGAATTAPQTPRRSWLGPVAGLAAGLGLAALASHFGFGEEMGSMLLIALLVMAVVVAVRMFAARKRAAESPMQYAGMGAGGGMSRMAHEEPVMSSSAPAAATAAATGGAAQRALPADFDAEGFVRQAKLNFIRLQAANDAGNVADLREFVSPEVFAELQMQIAERGSAKQHTEVLDLHAEIIDFEQEAQRYIVSVRFGGLIREEVNGPAERFDEIWHLTKPTDGNRGWVVAGVQQLN